MLTPLGKYCRKLRIDRNLNLKLLSSMMGVTPSYVSAVETGKKPATQKYIRNLVSFFGEEHAKEFVRLSALQADKVVINISERSETVKQLMFRLADKFGNTPDETLIKLLSKI